MPLVLASHIIHILQVTFVKLRVCGIRKSLPMSWALPPYEGKELEVI